MPLDNLMEDAATAEISRVQIWQWVRYPKGVLDNGREITRDMVGRLLADEVNKARLECGAAYKERKFDAAAKLLETMLDSDSLPNFLTSEAYKSLP